MRLDDRWQGLGRVMEAKIKWRKSEKKEEKGKKEVRLLPVIIK